MQPSIHRVLRALCLVISIAFPSVGNAAELTPGANEQRKDDDLVLQPVPWLDGERLQFTLLLGNGLGSGTLEHRTILTEADGRKVWRVGARMFAQGNALSWVDADAETFRPIKSSWKHSQLGEAAATFKPAEVRITRPGKDPSKFEPKQTVYDNEQSIYLMRRLPLTQGYKATLPLVASLGSATVTPVRIEVTEKEMIEAPAGRFECFKVAFDVAQTFWFSTDARRYLVKLETGGATALLDSITQRKTNDPVPFRNDELGVTFTAPANWVIFYQRPGGKPHVIRMLDPKAEAEEISLRLFPTESLSETARADVRKWAEKDVPDRLAKGLKDFKIQADSWKTLTVSGRPGVSVIADYGEKDKRKPLFAIYALGPKTSEHFVLMSPADKFSVLKPALETIVETYRSK